MNLRTDSCMGIVLLEVKKFGRPTVLKNFICGEPATRWVEDAKYPWGDSGRPHCDNCKPQRPKPEAR